jgi:hypothetical protein
MICSMPRTLNKISSLSHKHQRRFLRQIIKQNADGCLIHLIKIYDDIIKYLNFKTTYKFVAPRKNYTFN